MAVLYKMTVKIEPKGWLGHAEYSLKFFGAALGFLLGRDCYLYLSGEITGYPDCSQEDLPKNGVSSKDR
ncbi:MAG: hypothetical protein K9K21_02900 [Desulfotignum sp.]|nr:hypothetical protein [Desulfotignum sp.]